MCVATKGAEGAEPTVDIIDGVVCEVAYALDKQLDLIEKNLQGTEHVRARMRAQELAMTTGDGYRVVETRPW